MRRFAIVTLLVLSALTLLAGTASAQSADSTPWGSEDPDTWCKANGDYSDPNAPRFDPACSAYWHPVAAEVHPAPVKQAAPVRKAQIAPPRKYLAATGSADILRPIAVSGILFLLIGAVMVRASIRRQEVSL